MYMYIVVCVFNRNQIAGGSIAPSTISVLLPLTQPNVAWEARRCIHNPTCSCPCLGMYVVTVYATCMLLVLPELLVLCY